MTKRKRTPRKKAAKRDKCTVVYVEAPSPSRNALQSISDWWHGGSTQGARTRHMRVNY